MWCGKPSNIKTGKKYLMQIVQARANYHEKGSYGYHLYIFMIRIWPDSKNLDCFYDTPQIFYDTEKSEKYLVDFVEKATDCHDFISNGEIEFAIGAVFKGILTDRIRRIFDGSSVSSKVVYDINVVKHLGYCEVENENEK